MYASYTDDRSEVTALDTVTPISDYFSLPPLVLNPHLPQGKQATLRVKFDFYRQKPYLSIEDPVNDTVNKNLSAEGIFSDTTEFLLSAEKQYDCHIPAEYFDNVEIFDDISEDIYYAHVAQARYQLEIGNHMEDYAMEFIVCPPLPGYSSASIKVSFSDSNKEELMNANDFMSIEGPEELVEATVEKYGMTKPDESTLEGVWFYEETLEGLANDDAFMRILFYRLFEEWDQANPESRAEIGIFLDSLKKHLGSRYKEYVEFAALAQPDECLSYLRDLPETAHLAYDPSQNDDS